MSLPPITPGIVILEYPKHAVKIEKRTLPFSDHPVYTVWVGLNRNHYGNYTDLTQAFRVAWRRNANINPWSITGGIEGTMHGR